MDCRPFAAAALLFGAACTQEAAPSPEYRPGDAGTVDHALCLLGYTAVPVREVTTGHHLVDAEINGRSGSFVLDTGANVTVIQQGQAEQFGLSGQSGGRGAIGRASLPAGAGVATQAGVDSFTIGPVEIRQSRVVIADMGQLLGSLSQVAGEQVAGLIGQDVLTEHRAIVDVARPMLYLMAEDEDPAPVPADRCSEAGEQAAS